MVCVKIQEGTTSVCLFFVLIILRWNTKRPNRIGLFKGEANRTKTQSLPENLENVQILPSLAFVWFYYNFYKRSPFFFSFSSFFFFFFFFLLFLNSNLLSSARNRFVSVFTNEYQKKKSSLVTNLILSPLMPVLLWHTLYSQKKAAIMWGRVFATVQRRLLANQMRIRLKNYSLCVVSFIPIDIAGYTSSVRFGSPLNNQKFGDVHTRVSLPWRMLIHL